jgi:subtilisin-like proprotein convertase family protein
MQNYKTLRQKSPVGKLFYGALAGLLLFSMMTPVWAVVFTNPAAITINDATTVGTANPYSSNITVSGMTGTITNITVGLSNINHTFPDDLDLLLVAPNGNNLVIFSDAGGSADVTNISILFDDAAAATVTDGGPLMGGTFKPSQFVAGDIFPAPAPAASANTTLAAAFNGIDPNGAWNLYAVDDTGVDMGTIGNGWSLNITTTGTAQTAFSNIGAIFLNERFTAATPYGSPITVSGLTGAITDINVTLTNINHLNPDDIDILLVGPSGKNLMIMSDAGGTPDAVNVTITLDDSAATALPDAGPLVAGTFRPANFGSGDTLANILPPLSSSGTAAFGTLASVFNGTQPNGAWNLYIVDDATASTGSIAGGWAVDITASGTYGAKRFTSSDFNGDGKTDVSVYRPSDSNWWNRNSTSYANTVVKWGTTGDIAIPADYDGDAKTDLAIFRPSNGNWIVLNSATSTVSFTAWGLGSDTLVPEDYDADGKVDLAVYRASEGRWYIRNSTTTAMRVVNWGLATDIPLRGHFEGTDGADFAVFRPSEGNWYILNSTTSSSRVVNWGLNTDELVPADYDGDGKTDIAVFRGSEGNWYVIQSATSTNAILHWGQSGDVAVPGDYDGDSRVDYAIFRPSDGAWYLFNSGQIPGAAAIRIDTWGLSTDTLLPATYLPPQ